jgi:hypothetical protein
MRRFLFGLLSFFMLTSLTLLVFILTDPPVEAVACIVFLVSSVWILCRPVMMEKILAVFMLASFILLITEHR